MTKPSKTPDAAACLICRVVTATTGILGWKLSNPAAALSLNKSLLSNAYRAEIKKFSPVELVKGLV